MTRPRVAVAGMPAESISGLRRPGFAVSGRVVESVWRAGGEPFVLPPLERDGVDLSGFAAAVLPGGDDLGDHPAHDAFDLALARSCLLAGTPLLAICRGMQVLNVALGGTLVPDLPPSSVDHLDTYHPVALEPGSLVAEAVGATAVTVSSYHHQALDRLGRGLRVTGRADDGCIEAVQLGDRPVLAVQWHPEDDAHHLSTDQALFDALLALSRQGALS